jgi:hypothetical protein
MMILACFSRFGIENIVLLPSKKTFHCEFFVEKVLADFDEERVRNCPRKHSKDTFLHLDNVTPHQAPRDFDCFGIKRLSHPPYSPDLVPRNFWLFGMLKRKLEGSTFGDPIEVLNAVSTIRSTILLDEFISVFDE